MDYKALGLVAGIEIHQQLNTQEKLFCHCLTMLREIPEHNGEFFRYLRATVSEMGEIDGNSSTIPTTPHALLRMMRNPRLP
jgi:glutamyl-tRNA(Gln) amidotransferase subunit E